MHVIGTYQSENVINTSQWDNSVRIGDLYKPVGQIFLGREFIQVSQNRGFIQVSGTNLSEKGIYTS